MSPVTLKFIKGSLAYLGAGIILGILLAIPSTEAWLHSLPGSRWNLAHAHLMLAGFVTMMIFGVAYHIIPRFSGRRLWSPRLAEWHFWLAATGTAGMAFGFGLAQLAPWLLPVSGLAQGIGLFFGIYTLWRTMPTLAELRAYLRS